MEADQGSCQCGDGECQFSHNITDDQRKDEQLVKGYLEEKEEKASKCLNEFREEDSCRKGDK